MTDTSQESGGWREAVAAVLTKAADDPEGFEREAKLLARRFGMTVEQVYQKLQHDPDVGPSLAKNKALRQKAIKSVANWIKRQLGS